MDNSMEKEYSKTNDKECKVTVIDSIMGTGKTTIMIDTMIKNKDRNYIFITPYLSEIERVKKSLKENNIIIKEPKFNKNGNKKNSFKELLIKGENICCTHSLFQKTDNEIKELIKAKGYTLILDEVMDVVSPIYLTSYDFNVLKDSGLIYIENDYLLWNKDKLNYKGKHQDIMEMAINKSIICYDEKLFLWNFPIDIFRCFEKVYILTYLFECQIQRYYYDYHKLNYKTYQIDDSHNIVPFTENLRIERLKKNKNLINIYNGKLNNIGKGEYSLSKSWYHKHSNKDTEVILKSLKNDLYNYFNNINKDKPSSEKMWSAFKDYKSKLKGKGYTKGYVSINCRGTNDYIDKSVLAYMVNRFPNTIISNFFSKKGITIDKDKYALSEMLQWIWRSRIRKNESINIYIPSERMRNILIDYLNK